MNKDAILTSFLLFGPIIILIFVFYLSKSETEKIISVPIEENTFQEMEEVSLIEDIKLIAKAAFVKDLTSGEILYAKNEYEVLPLASLTKMMTAVTAVELLGEKSFVKIKEEHLKTIGNDGLVPNEIWEMKDLLDFTLVGSSNSGAQALAYAGGLLLSQNFQSDIKEEDLFVSEMNKIAKKIGMKKTFFSNESGLDMGNNTSGANGSAEDVALLFEYILDNHPEILDATKEKRFSAKGSAGFVHTIENTNQIIDSLPNILGSKTGYTELAGGNLAVIVDPGLNTPVVIVVLGSTQEGRFEDVDKLASTLFK